MRCHMARDMSSRRKWSRTTPYTVMVSARVPIPVADRLREYVESTKMSRSDIVINAIKEYLDKQERAQKRLIRKGGVGNV